MQLLLLLFGVEVKGSYQQTLQSLLHQQLNKYYWIHLFDLKCAMILTCKIEIDNNQIYHNLDGKNCENEEQKDGGFTQI